mmetsp:Transcript_17424/g.39281  ORF Transcript_17424/g.39281 Transcript_17424/m.39281 type:complete len:82 (+) Transcript_17424:176-421(+)
MRLCGSRGAGSVISLGRRVLGEFVDVEDEEASSRYRKGGACKDHGHSSRALNMSVIHDEPHQVGDDTEDDREESRAGSAVN